MPLFGVVFVMLLVYGTTKGQEIDKDLLSDDGKKWINSHKAEFTDGIRIMTGAFWCRFRGNEWLERTAIDFGNHLRMSSDKDFDLDKTELDKLVEDANNAATNSYLTHKGAFCGKINDDLPEFEKSLSK